MTKREICPDTIPKCWAFDNNGRKIITGESVTARNYRVMYDTEGGSSNLNFFVSSYMQKPWEYEPRKLRASAYPAVWKKRLCVNLTCETKKKFLNRGTKSIVAECKPVFRVVVFFHGTWADETISRLCITAVWKSRFIVAYYPGKKVVALASEHSIIT